ncbi:MAG: hypothetical protein EXR99_07805 [Gemmataceae bacterium]|nr:hypothetical protein [Gemmataceae bacterium]
MITTLGALVTLSALAFAEPKLISVGYLWHQKSTPGGQEEIQAVPYVPCVGDVLLFDDMSRFWTFLYKIAGTAPPFHAGIVFKKPDGSLAVLESGPDDTLHVFLLDIHPRLHDFEGSILIRQTKKVLSQEESKKLTDFAVAQDGKRYAMWRLLLQGTPVRHRGGIKEKILATTYADRSRWLCAEIVVSAGTLVGLFDPAKVKGTTTYPLDMVDDVRIDLSATFEPPYYWSSLTAPKR